MSDALPPVPLESRLNAIPSTPHTSGSGCGVLLMRDLSIPFGGETTSNEEQIAGGTKCQPTMRALPAAHKTTARMTLIEPTLLQQSRLHLHSVSADIVSTQTHRGSSAVDDQPRLEKALLREWASAELWLRYELDATCEIIPLKLLTLGKLRRRPNTYCTIQGAILHGETVEVTWLDAVKLLHEKHDYMRIPSLRELVENGVSNWKLAPSSVATRFMGVVFDAPRIGLIARNEGEPLKRFLQRYPDVLRVEEHRHQLMEQIARAVDTLHSPQVGILHRDLSEDTVIIKWEYEQVRMSRHYVDVRPVVRVRLSHFIHSRRLAQRSALSASEPASLLDPPCGPRLHYMAPEEFNVPSNGPRRITLKVDIWKMGLLFRQLHNLRLNVKDALNEYELWVESHRLVPVRYGKQEAEYITPLPKMVNAMSSLLPSGRWSAAQVLQVLLRPGTAHHLPHPPLGLLRSIPDPTTQYPRYDPVVQKLEPPLGFSGGDLPLQPAIIVVPHLGHVWSSTAPPHEDSERCKICSSVYAADDPNAKYVCLSCGHFHEHVLAAGCFAATSSPIASPSIPPLQSNPKAARVSTRSSFCEGISPKLPQPNPSDTGPTRSTSGRIGAIGTKRLGAGMAGGHQAGRPPTRSRTATPETLSANTCSAKASHSRGTTTAGPRKRGLLHKNSMTPATSAPCSDTEDTYSLDSVPHSVPLLREILGCSSEPFKIMEPRSNATSFDSRVAGLRRQDAFIGSRLLEQEDAMDE